MWADQVVGGFVVIDRRTSRPPRFVAARDVQPPQVTFGST
jgi:hypothetical protein